MYSGQRYIALTIVFAAKSLVSIVAINSIDQVVSCRMPAVCQIPGCPGVLERDRRISLISSIVTSLKKPDK